MAKKIIKAILKYPLILINRIYTYFYYKNSDKKDNYLVDDMFKGENKVLVFAPHVDDETIGAGGTLIRHKNRSDKIVLVYISDGGSSTSELSREEVVLERKNEGECLKKTLGIYNLYFLDEPDGSVNSSKEELIEKIVQILEIEKPDIIYTPFIVDGHRDHVETTISAIKAIEKWNSEFDSIYMYEVNSPILPSTVNALCIMDEKLYNEKEEIYKIFTSQWAMGFSAFSLLNRRKKLIAGEGYGAEVFVKSDVEEARKALEVILERGFKPEQFKQLSSEYNLLMAYRQNSQLKNEYNTLVDKVITEELARR
ncbi:PIG-L deacetylase family protein [Sporanaerobacter acetigenes]|uniref:PIG-L deacetylase family protein n=1 Tax=Sporanaerobacter acetigenes TaxID=165813 RepID=UPI001043D103|nr:PIG-L family deacetylase [Sporanaerobacter acetigenes]